MTDSKNCQWILNARPAGKLTGEEFLWNEASIPRPSDGQVLIRTLWLSVDPAQRIWIARDSYKPAIPTSPRFRLAMSCSPLLSGR